MILTSSIIVGVSLNHYLQYLCDLIARFPLRNNVTYAKILNRIPNCRKGVNFARKYYINCTECGDRNYISTKNKRTTPERIEMKKY